MKQHNLHSQKSQPTSKRIRFLSLGLAMILLLTCLSACKKEKQPTNEELIENRITTFATAYNDGDMDTVLSCLDAKRRNAFQAMLNLLGELAGNAAGFNVDLSDLFSLGVSTTSGDFMELEINDITVVDSSNATVKTKINLTGSGMQTLYFLMIYENESWFIHDISDKAEASINNSNQTGTSISILEINNFDNGNAPIKFKMNDKIYSGVINPKGEIIYYSEESKINWTAIGNGAGFIKTNDDKKTFILFNEDGNKTITADEDVFDAIIGYGDGLILVYKNTSTITTEEHSYGVLDCNGNWVKPLNPGPELPPISVIGSRWTTYKYFGDGIFISEDTASYKNKYVVFNTNNNQTFVLHKMSFASTAKFLNGIIHCGPENIYQTEKPTLSYPYRNNNNYEKTITLPMYFALHSDATFEALSESEYSDHNDFRINTKGEYIRILDKNTNTENEYTEFPTNIISSIRFDGDFGLITLNGADGKTYFTVIDKQCNQKVAPTVCLSATISDGRIVYKNSDGIYEVMDVNGTIIIPESQGFTYISSFSYGIAKAENSNGECYIGLDGKPLVIKLK